MLYKAVNGLVALPVDTLIKLTNAHGEESTDYKHIKSYKQAEKNYFYPQTIRVKYPANRSQGFSVTWNAQRKLKCSYQPGLIALLTKAQYNNGCCHVMREIQIQ